MSRPDETAERNTTWRRPVTRGAFIKSTAGVAGAAASAGGWLPALAAKPSNNPAPRPIPGGFDFDGKTFHVSGGLGNEPSAITDFHGTVGIAFIQGTGTGTDTNTGETTSLLFDSDMRFMVGEYIGADGRHHHGSFGFV